MKLTAKFVEHVSDSGKYYDQHGLFLHVRPSGAKKWLQRYTFKGRRREIGLGSAKIVSVAWRAPIWWSGLYVSALSAFGPSERCFPVKVDDSPMNCVA